MVETRITTDKTVEIVIPDSVVYIWHNAVFSLSTSAKIYYFGTSNDWDDVKLTDSAFSKSTVIITQLSN